MMMMIMIIIGKLQYLFIKPWISNEGTSPPDPGQRMTARNPRKKGVTPESFGPSSIIISVIIFIYYTYTHINIYSTPWVDLTNPSSTAFGLHDGDSKDECGYAWYQCLHFLVQPHPPQQTKNPAGGHQC